MSSYSYKYAKLTDWREQRVKEWKIMFFKADEMWREQKPLSIPNH